MRLRSNRTADALRVKLTGGEFPHVGRRSVYLGCGVSTCTCCCLTFVGAGVGGVVGLIVGIIRMGRVSPTVGGTLEWILVGAGQILLAIITGVCVGAALGFLCDRVGVLPHLQLF